MQQKKFNSKSLIHKILIKVSKLGCFINKSREPGSTQLSTTASKYTQSNDCVPEINKLSTYFRIMKQTNYQLASGLLSTNCQQITDLPII